MHKPRLWPCGSWGRQEMFFFGFFSRRKVNRTPDCWKKRDERADAMDSHSHILERCAAQPEFSSRVRASRFRGGWLTVCSHRAEWPEHFMCEAALVWLFSEVMRSSWLAESSHSRCSLTLPCPRANAQMQMSAQATGRGDKTHQVTLPFRTVNTLHCHRCVIPPHQTVIVIRCDRQHLCGAQKNNKKKR